MKVKKLIENITLSLKLQNYEHIKEKYDEYVKNMELMYESYYKINKISSVLFAKNMATKFPTFDELILKNYDDEILVKNNIDVGYKFIGGLEREFIFLGYFEENDSECSSIVKLYFLFNKADDKIVCFKDDEFQYLISTIDSAKRRINVDKIIRNTFFNYHFR